MIGSMYLIVVAVLFLWLVFQLFPLTFSNDVPNGNGNACIEPKEESVDNSKSEKKEYCFRRQPKVSPARKFCKEHYISSSFRSF